MAPCTSRGFAAAPERLAAGFFGSRCNGVRRAATKPTLVDPSVVLFASPLPVSADSKPDVAAGTSSMKETPQMPIDACR